EHLFAATEQLDEMLKDLNNILQLKSDVNEYKEIVNFQELVDVIQSSIRVLIETEKVQIITDFEAIGKMTTIKSYLHSIFFNLISNSIKYKLEGKPPVIRIRSETDKNKITFSFTDNGIGIDLDRHGNKIFGLYKRFHMHREGKGLGLFMVKTQVETLGGSIRVVSRPNEGAEFIIELPL
ncbi:MAG TPA: HAMP domain-containing sensor histidine kinase, partial [Bacteroidia bacterium]|nr:HAMP domain-containing sensor histidine kinase [Bacteroidia bacterium]